MCICKHMVSSRKHTIINPQFAWNNYFKLHTYHSFIGRVNKLFQWYPKQAIFKSVRLGGIDPIHLRGFYFHFPTQDIWK